ncbi:MAG TPA: chromate transporter, partial [Polyangiaceae bacterium]|nr:chromate transporter [Polyangiaceae bacterium]
MDEPATPPPPPRARWHEVALLFLRLGFTAFGGPAAHVAMMEEEVVRRRRWLTDERFLDMLGAANLIPGPSSSELAVFIGYEQAGLIGLLAAGVCFVLPAAVMSGAMAWAYVTYGSLPRVGGVLYGIKPVVI